MPRNDANSMLGEIASRSARVRKSRGKGLRTKTGCTVCRSRHVKCDERRPTCGACEKIHRTCVYSKKGIDCDVASLATNKSTDDSNGNHHDEATSSDPLNPPPNGGSAPIQGQYNGDREGQALFHSTSVHSTHTWDSYNAMPLEDSAPVLSPESTVSGGAPYSAEIAPLRWFNLLARDDSAHAALAISPSEVANIPAHDPHSAQFDSQGHNDAFGMSRSGGRQETLSIAEQYRSNDFVELADHEISMFRHFVHDLSSWIDLTDPDHAFSIVVPRMALKNRGLVMAILALSSRHLSLLAPSTTFATSQRPERTLAVQYYNETLQYLQSAMKNDAYLKSKELLATVLIISTYEMIDGFGKGWERHLKGVFWIQRSQLIHGESGGLKQKIWWAWLRQDLWAAFRERRKILSFYTLKRPCEELNQFELSNRVVFLLAQCVNFASDSEIEAGKKDVQTRLDRADFLRTSLNEWWRCFDPYRHELPVEKCNKSHFTPIWIHPPSCSTAVQAYHFAKLLLTVNQPAANGLKELLKIQRQLDESIDAIGGIAYMTSDPAATIISTECLFGAGINTQDSSKRAQILEMLRSHQEITGWPAHDLGEDLKLEWDGIASH